MRSLRWFSCQATLIFSIVAAAVCCSGIIDAVDAALLTVTKTGNGAGTVTSSPVGIDCGLDCTEDYSSGSTVTLTAVPAAGSEFDGWVGACNGKGLCKVKLTTDTTVEAKFSGFPREARQLIFLTQPGNGTAGVSLATQPIVEVRDVLGNKMTTDPDPGVVETVTVAFKNGTNQEGATLLGTTTLNVNWVTGQVIFTDLSVNLVGDYELTATTNLGVIKANSDGFSIVPPQLAFVTQPGAATVGNTIPGPPSVAVQDLSGNTLVNDNNTRVTVAVKPNSGTPGSALSGTFTRTVVGGVAPFNDLSIDLIGSDYVLTASAPGVTSMDSAAFDVTSLLNLAITDSADPVAAGGQVTYTLTFSNSSVMDTAFGITLTHTLAAHTIFVSASNGGSLDPSGTSVSWNLGDLLPGNSGTRTLVVKVNSPLPNGTLVTNRATLESNQGDSATAEETTTIQSAPVLSVSVSDTPDPVDAGEQITYTLSFSNASSANEIATGVTCVQTLATHTTFVSASDGASLDPSGNSVSWPLGDLLPGTSGHRTLVVQVDSPLPNGTLLTTSASLDSSQGDSAQSSQTTTVQSAAILALAQSHSPLEVFPGDQVTLTISFNNSPFANGAALEVTLTDTLPANASLVSASDGGTLDPSETLVNWSLGELPPGTEGTRSLVLQVVSSLPEGTLLSNHVTLTDSEGNSVTSAVTIALGTRIEESTEETSQDTGNDFTVVSAGEPTSPNNPTLPASDDSDLIPSTQDESQEKSIGPDQNEGLTASSQITQLTRDRLPAPRPSAFSQRQKREGMEEQTINIKENTAQECGAFLSLNISDSLDPAVVGDFITYTLSFANTSNSEIAKNMRLRSILSPELILITASDGGTDVGGEIIWPLGDILPGNSGSRSLVAQTASPVTRGSFLAANSSFLASVDGVCVQAEEFTMVEDVDSPNVVMAKGDDNDGDGFANHFEEACGSNPQDPASSCYDLSLNNSVITVRRGSGVSFTAVVKSDFNYEGPITISAANRVSGAMWIVSDPYTVLTNTRGGVSVSFTVRTTSSTPLGSHDTAILASSKGMTSQKILTLNVVK